MKKPKPIDGPKTNPPKGPAKGYPVYPKKDDIYNRAKEEKDLDPDGLSKIKPGSAKWEIDPEEELEIEGDFLGDDLDVPGSELDDDQEDIGNEDEENNYYSIGGDNHEDLEEDNQTYDLDEDES